MTGVTETIIKEVKSSGVVSEIAKDTGSHQSCLGYRNTVIILLVRLYHSLYSRELLKANSNPVRHLASVTTHLERG